MALVHCRVLPVAGVVVVQERQVKSDEHHETDKLSGMGANI